MGAPILLFFYLVPFILIAQVVQIIQLFQVVDRLNKLVTKIGSNQ